MAAHANCCRPDIVQALYVSRSRNQNLFLSVTFFASYDVTLNYDSGSLNTTRENSEYLMLFQEGKNAYFLIQCTGHGNLLQTSWGYTMP